MEHEIPGVRPGVGSTIVNSSGAPRYVRAAGEWFVDGEPVVESADLTFEVDSHHTGELVARLDGRPVQDGRIDGQIPERTRVGHSRYSVPVMQAEAYRQEFFQNLEFGPGAVHEYLRLLSVVEGLVVDSEVEEHQNSFLDFSEEEESRSTDSKVRVKALLCAAYRRSWIHVRQPCPKLVPRKKPHIARPVFGQLELHGCIGGRLVVGPGSTCHRSHEGGSEDDRLRAMCERSCFRHDLFLNEGPSQR